MSIIDGSVALLVVAIICIPFLAALCCAADRAEEILDTDPEFNDLEEADQ